MNSLQLLIIDALRYTTGTLIIIFLLYAVSQRKTGTAGIKKRRTSLYIAGAFIFLYFSIIFAERKGEAIYLWLVPFFAVIAFLLIKREVFSSFKTRCTSCGAYPQLRQLLFYDEPKCPACMNPETISAYEPMFSPDWQPKEKAVLCFVFDGEKVMLINKKRGLGAGKINAPGGRIENGETAEAAAVRETCEETGITPLNPVKGGELFFTFKDGYTLHGEIFRAAAFTGEMKETDEALPFWNSVKKMPYDKMWEDDELWFPLLLSGRGFKGYFYFDGDKMIKDHVEEAEF
jgi:8-oxo-dGTP diphosphatase